MKVCLIGNNLTSLILANILSKKNFYTDIYYSKLSKTNYKTRALGITEYNLNYLKKYFKNISKKTYSIDQIEVLIKNNKINKEILFNENPEILFNMVKYDELLSFFKSNLNFQKNISFKIIKKNYDLINLSNIKKYNLIINCESFNILTKKFLKKGITKNYFNRAFTTIITHKDQENHNAVQIFTKYGPIAFLPLSKKKTSVVFSYEIIKNQKISEDVVFEIISKFNPKYKILKYEKIESFDLMMRLPKKYYYKNILFFGDSIHSIHPVAGQGFNMTIRDIIQLDQIIDKNISLGLSIDKNIYKEFEKLSKSYNSTYSLGIDLIYEFFRFNKNFLPKSISEKIFTFINNNSKIKDLSINIANKGIF